MVDRIRIALAQLNPVMGDIAGNLGKARAARAEGRQRARRAAPDSFVDSWARRDRTAVPC